MYRWIGRFLAAVILSSIIIPVAGMPAVASAGQNDYSTGARLLVLLEKSGYGYTKLADNVWEVEFTGKNLASFSVRLVPADDLVVFIAKIADRGNVRLEPALLVSLLEMNDQMDAVKFALSKEILYARMESHVRLIDDREFKYLLDQMSGSVDEAYPTIKKFLRPAK